MRSNNKDPQFLNSMGRVQRRVHLHHHRPALPVYPQHLELRDRHGGIRLVRGQLATHRNHVAVELPGREEDREHALPADLADRPVRQIATDTCSKSRSDGMAIFTSCTARCWVSIWMSLSRLASVSPRRNSVRSSAAT